MRSSSVRREELCRVVGIGTELRQTTEGVDVSVVCVPDVGNTCGSFRGGETRSSEGVVSVGGSMNSGAGQSDGLVRRRLLSVQVVVCGPQSFRLAGLFSNPDP